MGGVNGKAGGIQSATVAEVYTVMTKLKRKAVETEDTGLSLARRLKKKEVDEKKSINKILQRSEKY